MNDIHYVSDRLTNREIEVLTLVASGMAGKHIAKKLRIAEKTWRNHMLRIREKLGASNSIHAVAIAISGSIIDPLNIEVLEIE